MARREITPAEEKAYRKAAAALAELQAVQEAAEADRARRKDLANRQPAEAVGGRR